VQRKLCLAHGSVTLIVVCPAAYTGARSQDLVSAGGQRKRWPEGIRRHAALHFDTRAGGIRAMLIEMD